MDYKELYQIGIRKAGYEKARHQYLQKSFLKRLFSKEPVDPSPGHSSISLLNRFTEEARKSLLGTHSGDYDHTDGTAISAIIQYYETEQGLMLPLLYLKYNDGSCFHAKDSRISVDGSVFENGIRYPESECGVTGLRREELPDRYKVVYDYAEVAVKDLQKLVKESLDILKAL